MVYRIYEMRTDTNEIIGVLGEFTSMKRVDNFREANRDYFEDNDFTHIQVVEETD